MKETTYQKENMFFSPYAMFSAQSQGRLLEEKPCSMRTEFQRDRDRIIYSKAFLRLKNKTQVFFAPDGDHYMSRLTHTLDVSQIARSIARCLALNEDLAEAIALGHDLGHTPFGHVGERVLNRLATGDSVTANSRSESSIFSKRTDGDSTLLSRYGTGSSIIPRTEILRRSKAQSFLLRTGSPISITISKIPFGRGISKRTSFRKALQKFSEGTRPSGSTRPDHRYFRNVVSAAVCQNVRGKAAGIGRTSLVHVRACIRAGE